MLKTKNLIILLFLIQAVAHGQVLQGTIKDSKGTPIPFSTVYVRELSLGTAANQDGDFSVKLPAGSYVCVFQSLGYQPVIKQIELKQGMAPLQIVLPDMVYDLSTVVISGKREDPSYRIMRKVISKAPYHATIVKSYQADVYIKGSLNIKSISKIVKWMAKDDLKELNIKEGDTYLQESVNEIEFTAPDIFKQKVRSFRNTFPESGGDRSENAIGFISGNIYRPDGFGAAYSPISRGAFNYYRFRYEGRTQYETYAVHKIAIIPKGKGSQYMQGTIYIVDGLWCVSNLDIFKDEQLGVKLYLTQNYNEVRQNAWLPVTNRMKIDVDLMGNSGTFNYHTSIRYNKLEVNIDGSAKAKVKPVAGSTEKKSEFHQKTEKKIAEKQKKLDELTKIENPNTAESYKIARLQQQQEELRIKDSLKFDHEYKEKYKTVFDSNAMKQDSSFWNKVRPIPLTESEVSSIQAYDSVAMTEKPQDSAALPRPAFLAMTGKVLLGGSLRNDTIYNFRSRGLINPLSLSFDVVDGLKYYTSFTFKQELRGSRQQSLQPMLGYAFGSQRIIWEVLAFRSSDPRRSKFGIRAGQQTFDYNPDGIHPLESTIESLIFRENPAKFYHASYLDVQYTGEIVHALSGSAALWLSDNQLIQNVTDYSFFFRDDKDYESNIPNHSDYKMEDHQDLTFELSLRYKPMPYYFIKNGIKVPYYSFNDTPEFIATLRKGLKVGPFDTNYDLVKVAVQQQKWLARNSRLNYKFEAGYFLNTRSMWFNQFQHFSKRPLIAGVKEFFPYFLLIDSYKFSTNEHYAVAHLQYKSPLLILKRLPLLRNRLWQESIFFSYLYTPENKNYMEPGYGIGGLIFNLGVFAGFNGLVYQQAGVRIAFTIFGSKEITL